MNFYFWTVMIINILLILSSVWDIVSWWELYCDVCVKKKKSAYFD